MTALGYDPADASTDPTTSAGIGNLAAQAVLEFRHRDGANQLGDEPGGTPGVRYSDWTGYSPVNTWDQVNDPYRWQPLCVPTPPPGATSCAGTVQRFAIPHWKRVTPFALTSPSQFAPPTMNRANLPADAAQLVDIQAKLTDLHKTIASYWADGPGSELPPGHWAMVAQAASRAGGLTLDANAKASSPSATPCWTPASPPGTPRSSRTPCGPSPISAGCTRAARSRAGPVPAPPPAERQKRGAEGSVPPPRPDLAGPHAPRPHRHPDYQVAPLAPGVPAPSPGGCR
jgi:hypothetical protein